MLGGLFHSRRVRVNLLCGSQKRWLRSSEPESKGEDQKTTPQGRSSTVSSFREKLERDRQIHKERLERELQASREKLKNYSINREKVTARVYFQRERKMEELPKSSEPGIEVKGAPITRLEEFKRDLDKETVKMNPEIDSSIGEPKRTGSAGFGMEKEASSSGQQKNTEMDTSMEEFRRQIDMITQRAKIEVNTRPEIKLNQTSKSPTSSEKPMADVGKIEQTTNSTTSTEAYKRKIDMTTKTASTEAKTSSWSRMNIDQTKSSDPEAKIEAKISSWSRTNMDQTTKIPNPEVKKESQRQTTGKEANTNNIGQEAKPNPDPEAKIEAKTSSWSRINMNQTTKIPNPEVKKESQGQTTGKESNTNNIGQEAKPNVGASTEAIATTSRKSLYEKRDKMYIDRACTVLSYYQNHPGIERKEVVAAITDLRARDETAPTIRWARTSKDLEVQLSRMEKEVTLGAVNLLKHRDISDNALANHVLGCYDYGIRNQATDAHKMNQRQTPLWEKCFTRACVLNHVPTGLFLLNIDGSTALKGTATSFLKYAATQKAFKDIPGDPLCKSYMFMALQAFLSVSFCKIAKKLPLRELPQSVVLQPWGAWDVLALVSILERNTHEAIQHAETGTRMGCLTSQFILAGLLLEKSETDRAVKLLADAAGKGCGYSKLVVNHLPRKGKPTSDQLPSVTAKTSDAHRQEVSSYVSALQVMAPNPKRG
eukprot:TRINITY_DN1681_c0_g1_i3.p1 TRINITY_DN1681_c0_g1~~TRINITY_DN1681_c0_g1_i3.p1  ORF type:complete len:711 (+),score=100.00 TRINITY_DN1681_c0_g1_i3:172-2304(+)